MKNSDQTRKYLLACGVFALAGILSGCYSNKNTSSADMAITTRSVTPMPLESPADPTRGEDYARIRENAFVSPLSEPLSTFALDVDVASYANIRRFIEDGTLPPADAVRTEELLNYFEYTFAQPSGEHPFAIHTEMSGCPWNPKHQLVQIALKGKEVNQSRIPASNLVFLLDVSGSMEDPDKLPLLKESLSLLVEQLREEDRVSMVVYAGAAGVVLEPTSGAEKSEILSALNRLQAGGSTAGGEGIELAYHIARQAFIKGGNNRIILATDGDFNVGTSSNAELENMIEKQRESGIFLSVLGFGTGNYQDDLMQILADKGNGNAAYIDKIQEAKKVLVSEMAGTLFTIAKDVKIQVEFNPAKVKGYRLIGYENRLLAAEDFDNDKMDAGELGAGHEMTALYEIIPAGSDEEVKSPSSALKYQQSGNKSEAFGNELMTVKFRYKKPAGAESVLLTHTQNDAVVPFAQASENFRWATSVAEFSLLLRNSEYKGAASWSQVLETARGAHTHDPEGYRAEFIELVKKAEKISEPVSASY